MKQPRAFSTVSTHVEAVDGLEEQVIDTAFAELEAEPSELASQLSGKSGDRVRVTRRSGMHHRGFEGSAACQVLADNEADRWWNTLRREAGVSN